MDAFLPNFKPAEPAEPVAPTDIKSGASAPLAKPLVSASGEQASPELLNQLQAYIEQTVVDTVSKAITTVIPDVVEATIAKQQNQTALTQPAGQQLAPVHSDDFADYAPGRYQGHRPIEKRQDFIAWISAGGIVAVMGGALVYAISTSAPVQSQQQNKQLTDQLTTQSQQLLESNQQILDSKQRCGNFTFACTIKE